MVQAAEYCLSRYGTGLPGGRRTTTGRLRPDRKARVHTRKPATEIIGLGDGGFKRPAACQ